MMAKFWHDSVPQDGIMRVRIDQDNRPVNALSRAALQELAELIERIRTDVFIEGVVFQSGKPGSFIVGADVTELQDLQGAEAARDISQFGQQVFADLEKLDVPTVALVSGACLGGGLEFALACRYRIADEHRKTMLGLPEVKLGLIPGWGGTVRLTKQIGLFAALPLILTGRMLNGRQARSKGVVHDVVPTEAFDTVGRKIIETCRQRGSANSLFRTRKKPLAMRLFEGSRWGRNFALNKAAKHVQKETRGRYPAPLKVIDALRAGMQSPKAGFKAETEAVAELAGSPVTTELMRLFFLQEDAKKSPAGLSVPVDPNSVKQAAVVGAGAMGAGIALLMAQKGIWTRLKDIKPEFVANGLKTARKQVGNLVKRRKISKIDGRNALDHLSPTTDYRGLKHADVVIEAIIENADVKRQVFAELAEASSPNTVLATNTSSLLVSEIARDVPHPERVVGLHFFNPPNRMPLVEVIRTEQTSDEALATALAVVSRIGKTKVVVGDCAGFLVNRLLSPYMNEAGFLLLDVDDPIEIERAAIEFGMPMGPLELTDLVGIDVAAHVARNMHAAYGDRMQPAPLWDKLQELRKSNDKAATQIIHKGRGGKQIDSTVASVVSKMRNSSQRISRDAIIERLIYPIINEAARCLDEGVVEKPDDVDLAMVFGTGFAPFRGGPLRYADSIGVSRIVETLSRLAETNPRLAPSEALRRMAEEGRVFFSTPDGRTETKTLTTADA
jgi:3-hydroxyacyl-CoA dehydrogenase/enoyl-CoA hydratase/3-hydroxybutyryl-CoA epimerase